jgi:FHS family L-fucose permease-like MFS transporter
MQVSGTAGTKTGESSKGVAVFPAGQMTLFVLVTVLFFLWGMSNNLTDILVQQFRKSFELSRFSAQLYRLLLHGDSGGPGDAALGL